MVGWGPREPWLGGREGGGSEGEKAAKVGPQPTSCTSSVPPSLPPCCVPCSCCCCCCCCLPGLLLLLLLVVASGALPGGTAVGEKWK